MEPVESACTLLMEIEFRNRFRVKVVQFIRTKNDWYAMVEDAIVRKCFDDQFGADAIQVATRDANNWLSLFTHDTNELNYSKSTSFHAKTRGFASKAQRFI